MILLNTKVGKYKFLTFGMSKYEIKDTRNYFKFDVHWSTKTDHAGLKFEGELFGFCINLAIEDSRHWDHEKEEWVQPDDNDK